LSLCDCIPQLLKSVPFSRLIITLLWLLRWQVNDRSTLSPGIVHISVGNFHRAHQALAIDRLLKLGLAKDWAICGAGIMADADRMASIMREPECLYTLIEKDNDGSTHARAVGSIIDFIDGTAEPEVLIAHLADERTRIVTLTTLRGSRCADGCRC